MITAIGTQNGKLAAIINGKKYIHNYNIELHYSQLSKYRHFVGKQANMQYWALYSDTTAQLDMLNTWN